MAQRQPSRPFESLDWYREAARRGFAEDDRTFRTLRVLIGGNGLRHHISLFAIAIVVLAAVNLLRTPESIWVDRVMLIWIFLLIVHGVAVGARWAMRQWNADDIETPVRLPASDWRQSPMFGWDAPAPYDADSRDATVRVAEQPAEPPRAPWADWTNATETPEPPAPSERVSWSDATVTSWLRRRSLKEPPSRPGDRPES